MRAEQSLLALVGQPGANDSGDVFFWFRVDDDPEPAIDWADCDEAVFRFRVLCVEDLEMIGARLEEPLSLCEREPVLSPVAEVLRVVPLEGRGDIL
jgi:hypothetical protein